MRVLALDWGSQRVGAAISDPTGRIAFPLHQPLATVQALRQIKDLVLEHEVDRIVVGWPRTTAGATGRSAAAVRKFGEQLARVIKRPIIYLDERFTTTAATKLLHTQGLSERKQRSIKDNVAAQIILQRYLDREQTNV